MQIKTVNISEIRANNYNPNSMRPTEYRNLIYSIKKFGQVIPILVRKVKENYIIIDGEHRHRALKEIGIKQVEVIENEDMTEKDYKMLTVALNKFRGNIDNDLVMEIFKDSKETDVLEFLEKIREKSYEKMADQKSIFEKLDLDWEDNRIYEENKETEPLVVMVTKGELEQYNDYKKKLIKKEPEILKQFVENCSKRAIDEDEEYFLLFSLATRRAFLTRQLSFRDNPKEHYSIVYRDNKQNIIKFLKFIQNGKSKSDN